MDSWFYPAAIIAVLITGISKSGLGGGIGGIAVPVLALTIAPAQAAAIMLPILCFMDLLSVRAYRGRWNRQHVLRLVPAAIVGIVLGAMSFRSLEADHLRLLLGLISIVFCLNAWFRRRDAGANHARPGILSATIWGATSGFTSTIAHSGGPPLSMYLLPQRLDRSVFVGTSAVFFLSINYVKLVPYFYLGLLDFSNLKTSLLLAPLAPLGVWLGLRIHDRLNEVLFYRLVYLALFATGIKLIHTGLGL